MRIQRDTGSRRSVLVAAVLSSLALAGVASAAGTDLRSQLTQSSSGTLTLSVRDSAPMVYVDFKLSGRYKVTSVTPQTGVVCRVLASKSELKCGFRRARGAVVLSFRVSPKLPPHAEGKLSDNNGTIGWVLT
jgi:hypothetical protein